MLHSILFVKDKWTPIGAIMWLINHGYSSKKMHESRDYYRFRQVEPKLFRRFRTIWLDDEKGIKVVITWDDVPS